MAKGADLRALVRDLFDAATMAADPALAVRRHFSRQPLAPLPAGGCTYLIAIGKAAPAMLREALFHVPEPRVALGVTHYENAQTVDGATLLTAGHPVPDEAGLDAARQIIALLSRADSNDRVLTLVSGGGSALVPAPRAPLTLADKQAVNRALLENGIDITAMNMVRQQLSELKGGGFLRLAAPAPVTALILSDVIGNDLRVIASGPTVAPLGSRDEAVKLLTKHNIFRNLPDRVQTLLLTPHEMALLPKADNYLIGSNDQSLQATLLATPQPWIARIASYTLTGDVSDAAELIVSVAQTAIHNLPTALIFGGETTVQIRGTGRGGRNQELALRIALQSAHLPAGWVFLSGGTDGRDGPTDAAGGIVDSGTLARLKAAGLDAQSLLENNDSYAALYAAGDLLITGATGTNVADVQVMLLP